MLGTEEPYSDKDPHPPLCLLFLGPQRGWTPLWPRLARFRYTHVVIARSGAVIDQPIKGKAWMGTARQWVDEKDPDTRLSRCYYLLPSEGAEPQEADVAEWVRAAVNRPGQKWASVLRYLQLWRRPVWNCAAIAREAAELYHITLAGETPDELVRELERLGRTPGFTHRVLPVGAYCPPGETP